MSAQQQAAAGVLFCQGRTRAVCLLGSLESSGTISLAVRYRSSAETDDIVRKEWLGLVLASVCRIHTLLSARCCTLTIGMMHTVTCLS